MLWFLFCWFVVSVAFALFMGAMMKGSGPDDKF